MGIPNIPNCLPRWHGRILAAPKLTISSGCPPIAGYTQCDANAMRSACESQIVNKGYWPAGKPLSLTTYTLARYIASEVGSGSPEDMVMVGTCAKNQARHRGITINGLLLTRNARGIAAYGPIHGDGDTAPFGRWASTSRDPTVKSIYAADIVVSGESTGFATDAYDQFGPNAGVSLGRPRSWVIDQISSRARNGEYWIGPWPGVNWFKTFGFMFKPDIPANSTQGQHLQSRAIVALKPMLNTSSPDVNWEGVGVCSRIPGPVAALGIGAVGVAGAYWWKKRNS